MLPIIEYSVLTEYNNLNYLVDKINTLIKEGGWQPFGNLIITQYQNFNDQQCLSWAQVMVKYETTKKTLSVNMPII